MATSLQRPLSSVPKVAIVEKFNCTTKNRTYFYFVYQLIALATIENSSLEQTTLYSRSCLNLTPRVSLTWVSTVCPLPANAGYLLHVVQSVKYVFEVN